MASSVLSLFICAFEIRTDPAHRIVAIHRHRSNQRVISVSRLEEGIAMLLTLQNSLEA